MPATHEARAGRRLLVRFLLTFSLTALSQCAYSAGFALIEQSVAGMGTAYAGAAASADTVDTLYFNPAGMTRLPGTRTGAAVHLVLPQKAFKNEGTSFVVGGAPIGGGDGGDAGQAAAVPHAYATRQLNDDTWFGLAVNAPFGLTTEYDSDWVGRYHAIKSSVTTVNINPSIAYRVNDRLSIAGGVSAMYLDGEFTNAIDFGTLDVLPGQPLTGWAGGTLGPGQADGKSDINGDSWGWGVNVGLLYEIDESTRIGLHYRSEVEQDIEGTAKFKVPDPGLATAGFRGQDVEASVDLPASVSISAFHQVNRAWAIMADYTWTGWSSIPELRFEFDDSIGLPDGVTTFDWKDTSRVAIGTTYAPNGNGWTYRFGVAYDESPIKDANSRSARLPDADRIWLTIGASINPTERLSIDIGYAHLFIDDPEIRKTGTEEEDVTRGALRGSYASSVDIVSVEARYVF
jgi:long-chain fatty acid transport protein